MSNEVLVAGQIQQEERRGWSRACPRCAEEIRYTVLNLSAGVEPFLYCDEGSDFVLREEDKKAAQQLARPNGAVSLDDLRAFYRELQERLPPCPNGGRFGIWSNVKCPHCGHEFPYAGGERDEEVRFLESKIVWVEGATAFRGSTRPSSRLAKVVVSDV